MTVKEVRAAAELRASGRRLVGYVARWDSPARIGTFTETVKRGAFAATIASGDDVVCMADHDPKAVLGRTKSGTLSLREDEHGLAFDLAVPDTQKGRDLLALAERGDLGGCSFGFTVNEGGDHWSGDTRELRSVRLHEVSIVQSWPAYGQTSVEARSVTACDQLALLRYWLETVR